MSYCRNWETPEKVVLLPLQVVDYQPTSLAGHLQSTLRAGALLPDMPGAGSRSASTAYLKIPVSVIRNHI
jgi:hypothetical protein